MKEDIIGVTFIKTDLGIQTILCAYPNAECRQEHMDEGYKIIYEKELYELPLLDRCAREGYRMTKEEEKQVEKEVKEYFSIEKYQQIKYIIEKLGIDAYYRNPPKGLTQEEQKKFEQMYLLYRKTNDLDAFGYGIGNSFILTKPFMYGGIVDHVVGYPETKAVEYLQMAVEQNPNSSLAGTIVGGGVSYAVGSAVVSKIPGVGKVLGNAGQALSKLPLLNKLGAEGITRVVYFLSSY